MGLNSRVSFKFCSVLSNVLQKISFQNIIYDLEKPTKFQRPCQGKIAREFIFYSYFPGLTCTHTFQNYGKTVRNFGMGSFAYYHKKHW